MFLLWFVNPIAPSHTNQLLGETCIMEAFIPIMHVSLTVRLGQLGAHALNVSRF